MGLFINNEHHHGMYKSSEKINEPNQATFRRDHLAELLKAQQKMNDSLYKSMLKLGVQHEQQNNKQSNQWKEVSNRLGRIEEVNNQQDQRGVQITEQLMKLTDENEKLQMMIKNNRISDQKIIDQINQQSLNSNQLSQHLIEQKESQQEVLTRLDNQEALTEKALRQISNLRASLFERTNDLAETIEDSYKLTSSYFYQLLTGADEPLTFFMSNEKRN